MKPPDTGAGGGPGGEGTEPSWSELMAALCAPHDALQRVTDRVNQIMARDKEPRIRKSFATERRSDDRSAVSAGASGRD